MPIKICFPFVGDTLGGSHFSTLQLIRSLDAARFDCRLVVHQRGILTNYLDKEGLAYQLVEPYPVDRVRGWNAFWRKTVLTLQIARRLRRSDIDIVHTQDRRMHYLWGMAAKLAGKKHVWHQRTTGTGRRLSLFAKQADRVIAISRATSLSAIPGTKIIPNPVEPDRGVSKAEHRRWLHAKLGLAEDTRIVVHIANWTERKRPLSFVDMAARLSKSTKLPLHFVMVGEQRQPMRAETLSRIEALAMTEFISTVGPQQPIEPWIAGSDVLVATAMKEAFGRTLAEAMLLETPVVAVADAGHLEVIEHGRNGRLVPPQDLEVLAEAVTACLVDDKGTSAMVAKALDDAVHRYAPSRHADQIAEIYLSLV